MYPIQGIIKLVVRLWWMGTWYAAFYSAQKGALKIISSVTIYSPKYPQHLVRVQKLPSPYIHKVYYSRWYEQIPMHKHLRTSPKKRMLCTIVISLSSIIKALNQPVSWRHPVNIILNVQLAPIMKCFRWQMKSMHTVESKFLDTSFQKCQLNSNRWLYISQFVYTWLKGPSNHLDL